MPTDQQKHGMGNGFQTFATKTSAWLGSRWSFLGAILIIVAWAVLGPYFHYSDTWQLVVNTATTIVTFLMVFLIQTRRTGTPELFTLNWTRSFVRSNQLVMN
jgi:low affinity Fe/Cu permease